MDSHGGNSLSLLLVDYNSDSDNDDSENANSQLNVKLEEFLTDLNATVTTNWTQCIDPNSGHPYYWNTLTKDVTWEIPDEYEKFLKQSLQSKDSNKENSYTVCYTDENVPYYVNEFTRQVSWEKPEGFVEAKPKIKENSTKSKKTKTSSSDRNDHKRKSSKKPGKPMKQYPFDGNDDLDYVKIEPISSFATKSDSSSDEESKSKKAKSNINLVANDYNSDENSESETRKTIKKPLFASSSLQLSNSIDPSSIKIYSLKTDLPGTVKTTSTMDVVEENIVEKPTISKTKANTFASIITGGRSSPIDQDKDLIELMKSDVTEVTSPANDSVAIDKPVEIDVKSFKRKRRIEFMTRPAMVKQLPEITSEDANSSPAVASEQETQSPETTKTSDESSAKPLYTNFVRANVEFAGALNPNSNDKGVVCKLFKSKNSENRQPVILG